MEWLRNILRAIAIQNNKLAFCGNDVKIFFEIWVMIHTLVWVLRAKNNTLLAPVESNNQQITRGPDSTGNCFTFYCVSEVSKHPFPYSYIKLKQTVRDFHAKIIRSCLKPSSEETRIEVINIKENKKVRLCERKRHTSRCAASARSAVLSQGGFLSWTNWEGGYTILTQLGGYPSLVLAGSTPSWPGQGCTSSWSGQG